MNSDSGEWITYMDGNVTLKGFLVKPRGFATNDPVRVDRPRPGVIIAHTAVGVGDTFILEKTREIAGMGFPAFALDMYGDGAGVFNRVS